MWTGAPRGGLVPQVCAGWGNYCVDCIAGAGPTQGQETVIVMRSQNRERVTDKHNWIACFTLQNSTQRRTWIHQISKMERRKYISMFIMSNRDFWFYACLWVHFVVSGASKQCNFASTRKIIYLPHVGQSLYHELDTLATIADATLPGSSKQKVSVCILHTVFHT